MDIKVLENGDFSIKISYDDLLMLSNCLRGVLLLGTGSDFTKLYITGLWVELEKALIERGEKNV